jgi:hypothetical protein
VAYSQDLLSISTRNHSEQVYIPRLLVMLGPVVRFANRPRSHDTVLSARETARAAELEHSLQNWYAQLPAHLQCIPDIPLAVDPAERDQQLARVSTHIGLLCLYHTGVMLLQRSLLRRDPRQPCYLSQTSADQMALLQYHTAAEVVLALTARLTGDALFYQHPFIAYSLFTAGIVWIHDTHMPLSLEASEEKQYRVSSVSSKLNTVYDRLSQLSNVWEYAGNKHTLLKELEAQGRIVPAKGKTYTGEQRQTSLLRLPIKTSTLDLKYAVPATPTGSGFSFSPLPPSHQAVPLTLAAPYYTTPSSAAAANVTASTLALSSFWPLANMLNRELSLSDQVNASLLSMPVWDMTSNDATGGMDCTLDTNNTNNNNSGFEKKLEKKLDGADDSANMTDFTMLAGRSFFSLDADATTLASTLRSLLGNLQSASLPQKPTLVGKLSSTDRNTHPSDAILISPTTSLFDPSTFTATTTTQENASLSSTHLLQLPHYTTWSNLLDL